MPSNSGSVYIDNLSSKSSSGEQDEILPENEIDKLNELEKRAKIILFEAQSQRPLFTRHRDRITICLNRVTITRGSKYAGDEFPMPIENITSARVYRNFRFASLEIDTFGVLKPDPLKSMKVDDARVARRFILGLIDCRKAGVDLYKMDIERIKEKLMKIGMVRFSSDDVDYHKL